jgi:hypothetical protein
LLMTSLLLANDRVTLGIVAQCLPDLVGCNFIGVIVMATRGLGGQR